MTEVVPGEVFDTGFLERGVKGILHIKDWLTRMSCVASMDEDVRAVEFDVAWT